MAVGLHEPTAPPLATLKRKREGDEIADSASESGCIDSEDDFGWVEDNTLMNQ